MHGELRADRVGRKPRTRDERTHYPPRHPASAGWIHLSNEVRKTAGYQDSRGHATARILCIRKPAADGITGIGFFNGVAQASDVRGGDEVQQALFGTSS